MFDVETLCCRTHTYTDNPAADFDALAVCDPACDRCPEDHHHGKAANQCKGGHGACPTPESCSVWAGMHPHKQDSNARDLPGPCPGGHCGVGVEGCTVCRPIKITALPGSVTLRRAN